MGCKMTRTRPKSQDRDQRKKHNMSASSQYQQILKKNRTVLYDNADFNHYKEHLMQEGLLTSHEIEDIEAERQRYKQMGRFLDIMERKTDSSVEKLLNIWKEIDPILYKQLDVSVPAGDDEQENISYYRDIIKRELQGWYIHTTSRLRPIPWAQWLEINLDHVFTNLEMVPGQKDEICPSSEDDDKTNIYNLINKGPNRRSVCFVERVAGICNCFSTSEDDDKTNMNNLINKGPNRRSLCFVEGVTGIGKSTLCKHLVYRWSKNNFNIGDHSLDFAFLLEARILTEDLKKSIKQQLFPEDFELSEDYIYKCLQEHQERSLIIIDGVDELTPEGKTTVMKLIGGEMLRHVNLVLTGRPEASREFIEHSNSHLKITGFTKENVKKYICKYFGSDSLKDRLLYRVDEDYELLEIMKNPFTTLLVCLLFKDKNGTLPRDLTEIQWEVLEICCRKYITKIKNSNTPDITQETLLSAAAHLAYEGYRRNLTAYPEESIASLMGPNDSTEHLLKSGILAKDFTVSRLNAKGFYFFPHKSFQELLCVKYLSELDNEKFEEKLKPFFQLGNIGLNIFRLLLDMLKSKSEVVLEILCQQVELGKLQFSVLSNVVWECETHLIRIVGCKLDKSHRLLSKTCSTFSDGLEYFVKKFFRAMMLPPVAHLPCSTYGSARYVFEMRRVESCNLYVSDSVLFYVHWHSVICYSLGTAVKRLKYDIKIDVLTIFLQPSDFHLLADIKRLLQSSRRNFQVKHVVLLYLEYGHQDEMFLTLLSRLSNLQNVVKTKPSSVDVEIIMGRNSTIVKAPFWLFRCPFTIQYVLHSSINQMYYNKFSPY